MLGNVEIEVYFSVLALVISVFSASMSLLNYRIRKRDERRNAPKIELYYQDGAKYKFDQKRQQINGHLWSFQVLLTNLSNSPNSIKEATMEFNFTDKLGQSGAMLIKCKKVNDRDFDLPIRLESCESKSGWLTFQVSQELYSKMEQLSYKIEITDVNSNAIHFSPNAIMTREYDGET